jgi:hypothetical protein
MISYYLKQEKSCVEARMGLLSLLSFILYVFIKPGFLL